jgi:hypothetical protein
MHPWVHLWSGYRGQWLPGDPRNFNSRRHRIHSEHRVYSDDPLNWDHGGLLSHAKSIAQGKVIINREVAPLLLDSVRKKLEAMEVTTAALACHSTHFHALIRVGDEDAKAVFGRAKQAGSHAVRSVLPGTIWGDSSGVRRIATFSDFASVFWYILAHVEEGAVVWRDAEIEKVCAAKHPDYRKSTEHQLGLTDQDR